VQLLSGACENAVPGERQYLPDQADVDLDAPLLI